MEVECEHEIYLHVGNGGVKFQIMNDIGPTVIVTMDLLGMPSSIKFHTTREGLKDIGELFIEAAEGSYTKEYSAAAKPPKNGTYEYG